MANNHDQSKSKRRTKVKQMNCTHQVHDDVAQVQIRSEGNAAMSSRGAVTWSCIQPVG